MNFYMGLDLSLTGTGLVVLAEDGLILRHLLVGSKLARDVPVRVKLERMIEIAETIVRTVRNLRLEPGSEDVTVHAGIEHYAFSRFGAFADLGEINGVVKTQLWLACNIEPQQVTVSSARKAVFGRGNLKKDAIIPLLGERGLYFKDHNVADAYVIAEALRRRAVDGDG